MIKMAEQKDVCSPSHVRTPKLQLTAEPLSRDCWIPQKKRHPMSIGKEAPAGQQERRNHF